MTTSVNKYFLQSFHSFYQKFVDICNFQVLYFELGGFEKRAMFWNLWCEKVKFLSPGDSGSSHSETSVATSSTGSTLYLLDQKLVTINGIKQLWCKFGSSTIFGGTEKSDINDGNLVRKWTDKHLYMGKDFEINFNYKPVADETQDYIVPKKSKSFKKITKVKYHQTYMEEKGLNFGDSVKVKNTLNRILQHWRSAHYPNLGIR